MKKQFKRVTPKLPKFIKKKWKLQNRLPKRLKQELLKKQRNGLKQCALLLKIN
jgi:hypothetical protein